MANAGDNTSGSSKGSKRSARGGERELMPHVAKYLMNAALDKWTEAGLIAIVDNNFERRSVVIVLEDSVFTDNGIE